MSDRIAVMYEGRIVGVFDRRDADREQLGLLMGGHAPPPPAEPNADGDDDAGAHRDVAARAPPDVTPGPGGARPCRRRASSR